MKNLFVLLLLLPVLYSQAQVLSNNGAVVNISTGNVVNGGTVENNSGTITVDGNLELTSNASNTGTMNGNGNYNIGGNWTNDGVFAAGTSTLIFNGASAQTIGGTTVPTSFNNITINNTMGGVSLIANENLTGTLTLTLGAFTTTGYIFTLISTISGTARIAEITGGTIAGNITMQRYVTGNDGFRMLASPVNSNLEDWNGEFAMSGFTGTEDPSSLYQSVRNYDQTVLGNKDQGWFYPTNTSEVLTAGKGYIAWIGDALGDPITKTLDLVGTPYTGSQTIAVTYTDDPAQPATEDGWNMVGNPFPSTIDWDAVGWTKLNVNDAIYIWRDDLGTYANYILGSGTNGGTQFIPSMQGFWVQTNGVTPSLIAPESVKSATDQPFFKKPATEILKLKITDTSGFYDESIIRFIAGADALFEGDKDAYKLFGNSNTPQLSSFTGDSANLSINSLPELSANITVPLGIRVTTPGFYSIVAWEMNQIPANYCILLNDKSTGIYTDLRTDSVYLFYEANTMQLLQRFDLLFLNNDTIPCSDYLSIITEIANPSGDYPPHLGGRGGAVRLIQTEEGVFLQFNYSTETSVTLHVYNVLGEEIIPEKTVNVKNEVITLETKNVQEGIYFVMTESTLQHTSHKLFLRTTQ